MPLCPTTRRLFVFMTILASALAPVWAIDEPLRALRGPKLSVETGPQPEIDLEAPPSAYPLKPVEQIAFRGARHGLVNTTTGTLAFQTLDLHLPGRMPIEMTRVFDTSISLFMPPPPPQQQNEPRWTYDLGKNWILGYAAYLVPIGGGVIQATPEGDLVWWNESGGVFTRQNDVPTKHWKLQRQSSTVIHETQLDGSKWTYTWQAIAGGNAYALTKVEDRNGNTITVTYTQGYISKIQNSDGAYVDVFRPIYDANYPATVFPRHRVTKLTDSTGRIVRFDFSAAGLLTKVTDARGKDWTFTYSWDDKVATATDPLGNVYLNATYDSQHRVATYEADAGTWTFNYAAGSNQTSATDAYGKAWVYTRAASSGITTGVLEPEGGSYQLVLDSANNPTSYSGPEGESIAWTYNADHRPLTYRPETSATAIITYAYNASQGWVDSVTDLSGGQTIYTRDAKGRVTQEQDPAGGKTTATYATNGDRLTIRLPLGNNPGPSGYLYTFGHDTYGNINTITDPTGRVFETDYDNCGNVWKVRKPDHLDENQQVVKSEWVYLHDAQGRLTSATDPLGNTWTRTFDDAGRLVAIDGPAGTKRRYTWDAKFRLTGVTIYEDGIDDPITTLTYDNAGRIATKTTPGGGVWNYEYDDSGRRVEMRDPLDRTWTYTRDLSGRIAAIGYPGGRTVSIDRFDSGLVQQRTFPNGAIETYAYDPAGRVTLVRMQDTAAGVDGQVEYRFDTMGRPDRIETTTVDGGSGFNRELTLTYDLNGNRTGTTVDFHGEENVSYLYDSLDRIVSADRGSTYGKTTALYDPTSGRRTEVNFRYPSTATEPIRWDRYFYDVAGRMNGRQWQALDGSGNVTWTLDGEGRFTAESDSISGTQKSLVYGFQGLPTAATESVAGTTTVTSLAYDPEGLLAERSETVGSDPASITTYIWDASRRLNAVYNGLTGVTYSWADAPEADTGAAFSVWRSQGNADDRMLDIRYGYDGRLRKVLTYHPQEPGAGTVAIENFWAPMEASMALITRERQSDDTISSRSFYFDGGGYYGNGNATVLVDPVQSGDDLTSALTRWSGAPMPLEDAAFRIDWPNVLRAASGEYGESLNGLPSSMPFERDLIAGLRQAPLSPLGSIGYHGAVSSPPVDFSDSWLNGTLMRSRGRGDDVLSDSTAGVTGWSSSEITPDRRDPSWLREWMTPRLGEQGVRVNLCEGQVLFLEVGSGDAEACWAMVSSSWLRTQGSCGGEKSTDTGLSEPLRDSETSVGGVYILSGEFTTSATDVVAWDPQGGIPFSRTYRSNVRVNGALGHRWFQEYDEIFKHVREAGCTPVHKQWVRSDGTAIDFFYDPDQQKYTAGKDATYQVRYTGTRWELRSHDGTVRQFAAGGQESSVKLEAIVDGARTLRIYRDNTSGKRITRITSTIKNPDGSTAVPETDRITFAYQTAGDVNLLASVTASGRAISYTYTPCRELDAVTGPALSLGYDKTGAATTSTYSNQVNYDYTNPATGDCTQSTLDGHKLIRVSERQFNPLLVTGPDNPKFEVRVVNAYRLELTNGESTGDYNRVIRQYLDRDTASCLRGEPNCSAPPPDLSYEIVPSASGRDLRVRDDRLQTQGFGANGTQPSITTRYVYNNQSQLTSITDDFGAGGLNRTTEFGYDLDGLKSLVRRPDGTCTRYAYVTLGAARLVSQVREQTAASCSTSEFGPDDLSTVYTYEAVKGTVRAVTRPEAFLGVAPIPYPPDLNDPTIRKYSTIYDYDFNQTASGASYPSALETYCTDWAISCPAKLGDVNTDSSDNAHWYGSLVRTRIWWGEGANDTTISKQVSQITGRPLLMAGVDGVQTQLRYYTSAVPGPGGVNWDWRRGGAIDPSGGFGPPGEVKRIPSGGGTALAKKSAWNASGELVATVDAVGVRQELSRDADGSILTEVTCKPAAGTQSCSASNSADNVLNGTRFSYDLRGQVVRTAALDRAEMITAGTGAKRVSWATYDLRGNVQTITVDPRASLIPGDFKSGAGTGLHLVSKSYYDGLNRVVATRSPEGRVGCLTYDNLGQVGSVRRLDLMVGAQAEADCTVADTNAVTTYTKYDRGGRVFRTTDGRGTHTYAWYDKFGRPAYVSDGQKPGTDALDPQLWESGLLPSVPSNWYRQTTYDAVGLPIRQRMRGRNGVGGQSWLSASWTTFDHLRRPTHQYVAVLDESLVDDVGTPVLVERTSLAEVDATADSGDGIAATRLVYRSDGKVLYQDTLAADDAWRRTEVSYDTFGRVDVTYGPELNGHRSSVDMDYDPTTGRKTKVKRTYYDPVTSNAHVEEARPSYDTWGRTIRTAGELGTSDAVTTVTLDAFSRPTETVKRWEDLATYTGYHAQDQVTTIEYDAAGRVTKSRQRQVGSPESWADTVFSYGDDGILESLTDARGNTTTWMYKENVSGADRGGLGRVRRMSYPSEGGQQSVVRYDSYDGNGNPLYVRQKASDNAGADSILWTQTYDIYNRMTSRSATLENLADSGDPTFDGTTSQTFTYDDRGLLVRAVDSSASLSPADVIAEFAYNVGGMVTEETQYFSGTPVNKRLVTSTYNKEAFRTRLEYPISWDASGTGLDRYALTYAQDGLGRLASITGPTDSLEPTAGATRATTTLASYRWAGTNLWDRRYEQNGADLRLYDGTRATPGNMLVDALGRLTGMRAVDSIAGGEPVVTDLRYGYNRLGDRTWEQRRHEPNSSNYRTRGFTPDQAGRLKTLRVGYVAGAGIAPDITDPAGAIPSPVDGESWNLDKLGNWDDKTTGVSTPVLEDFTPNNLNQLTQVVRDGQTKQFQFDWLGQMRQNDDRGQKMVWDAFGRLAQVKSAADVVIATYRYDALNRRVEKIVPSGPVSTDVTTRFVYDGWKILEERTSGSGGQYEKVRARYGYGTSLSEVLWMDRDAPRVSGTGALDPVTGVTNDTIELRAYLHADALGSVVAVSDKQRTGGSIDVIERFDYSAYGRRTSHTGAWTCIGATCGYETSVQDGPSLATVPIGYTGHYWDRETGLWYARSRFYDDRQGRFTSRDPLGIGGGVNLYGYVEGRPHLAVDALGLRTSEADRAMSATPQSRESTSNYVGYSASATGMKRESGVVGLDASFKNQEHYANWLAQLAYSQPGALSSEQWGQLQRLAETGHVSNVSLVLLDDVVENDKNRWERTRVTTTVTTTEYTTEASGELQALDSDTIAQMQANGFVLDAANNTWVGPGGTTVPNVGPTDRSTLTETTVTVSTEVLKLSWDVWSDGVGGAVAGSGSAAGWLNRDLSKFGSELAGISGKSRAARSARAAVGANVRATLSKQAGLRSTNIAGKALTVTGPVQVLVGTAFDLASGEGPVQAVSSNTVGVLAGAGLAWLGGVAGLACGPAAVVCSPVLGALGGMAGSWLGNEVVDAAFESQGWGF